MPSPNNMDEYQQYLGNILCGSYVSSTEEGYIPTTHLEEKRVFLYFSSERCVKCKSLTPQLVSLYFSQLAQKDIQLVFISSDLDEDTFHEYHDTMPWPAVPWKRRDLKEELCERFNVRRLPTLIGLDENFEEISRNDLTFHGHIE